MSGATHSRVLVVANRTASTPVLLAEVERRAQTGASFTLLIPPEAGEDAVDWSRDEALRLLQRAAGSTVECVDAGQDAVATIHRAVADGTCDEVIVSTVPAHHVRWLHHELPDRIKDLGVPVTAIPSDPDKWGPIAGFPPEWVHAVNPASMAGFGNY